jgi:hypothetical protein
LGQVTLLLCTLFLLSSFSISIYVFHGTNIVISIHDWCWITYLDIVAVLIVIQHCHTALRNPVVDVRDSVYVCPTFFPFGMGVDNHSENQGYSLFFILSPICVIWPRLLVYTLPIGVSIATYGAYAPIWSFIFLSIVLLSVLVSTFLFEFFISPTFEYFKIITCGLNSLIWSTNCCRGTTGLQLGAIFPICEYTIYAI